MIREYNIYIVEIILLNHCQFFVAKYSIHSISIQFNLLKKLNAFYDIISYIILITKYYFILSK